jgi:hypothetical protein
MKIPLMNTIGNFTTEAIMLIVAGRSVGGIEKTGPRDAKQKAARITARAKMRGLAIVIPRKRPRMMGTSEIPNPKANEARISPTMMISNLTGQDMSRSSVLDCVSQGITIGDTEVAVKKRTIPSSPGIMKSTDNCLPMVKARNRKTGKRTPKIITGPLE